MMAHGVFLITIPYCLKMFYPPLLRAFLHLRHGGSVKNTSKRVISNWLFLFFFFWVQIWNFSSIYASMNFHWIDASSTLIGVRFIELNFALASEECQFSPVGFDIIFPGMLDHARDLSLGFQLEPKLLNDLIHKRDMELGRYISAMLYCNLIISGFIWQSHYSRYA